MSRMFWGVVIVLSIIFPHGMAFGYEPEKVHRHLTEIAITVFNKCIDGGYGRGSIKKEFRVDDSARGLIRDANRDEDESNFPSRLFNWHFYNPARNEYRKGLLIFDESLERTFSRIEGRIESGTLRGEEAHRYIGRVLHYLEDMTVPAHVVPVYHGPNLPWAAHRFDFTKIKISDSVDSYLVDGKPPGDRLREELERTLADTCQTLSTATEYDEDGRAGSKPLTLKYILDATAKRTRAALTRPICAGLAPGSPTWQYFWHPPSPDGTRYFGDYQVSESYFGTRPQTITVDGRTCEPPAAAYDAFVAARHLDAVRADIRALFYISRKIHR